MNYTLRLAQLNRGVAAYVIAAVELICLAVFRSTECVCVCVSAALCVLYSALTMISDFTPKL